MSFVSIAFLLFAPIVVLGYYCLPSKYKWILLLVASYSFYGYWSIYYVPLLFVSSYIDYFCAIRMEKIQVRKKRKKWLLGSILSNLSILIYFKYWTFLDSNISQLFNLAVDTHNVLLPLGLSFYTLQTMSYSIDVYKGKIAPERHLGMFCLYVSFFPQLVAGPIERAKRLLPQLKTLNNPTIRQFRYGILLIVWGFFLKLVIADNLTAFIDSIYYSELILPVWLYWVAGALFMFKIYADFRGYSEIARGLAQLFGIELIKNFNRPFFAKNIRAFWQRWHISLTRWVIDYVQIPLMKKFPNEPSRSLVGFFSLLLIGIWHGASWNFVLFGVYHGIALILWHMLSKYSGLSYSNIFGRMYLAAILIFGAPLFYISQTEEMFRIMQSSISFDNLNASFQIFQLKGKLNFCLAFLGIMLMTLESYSSEVKKISYSQILLDTHSAVRWLAVSFGIVLTLILGNLDHERFIYFEF